MKTPHPILLRMDPKVAPHVVEIGTSPEGEPYIVFDGLRAYNLDQISWILDPFNVWVTGVRLGRQPTLRECEQNFVDSGGPAAYAKYHRFTLPSDDPAPSATADKTSA